VELNFEQGDETWQRLRDRGLKDLYFFNNIILGYGDKVPMRPRTHYLMCRFLERNTGIEQIDSAPIQKLLVPREVGKSTLGTQGRTIQLLCRNPNTSILICNEKQDNANEFLASIKWQFENNELFRALYPEIIPEDTNAIRWRTDSIHIKRDTGRKEPSVFTVGVGGTVTGMHPDGIIVDDMISREAAENARVGSRHIMEQANRWTHTLDPLLNTNFDDPFPWILFIGTRWWYNDCYDHIDEAWGYGQQQRNFRVTVTFPEDGTKHSTTLSRVGDLAIFKRSAIEEGRSIFPEKWDLEELAKKRLRDPVFFACNYQNEPTDDVTADFKEQWIVYYDKHDAETYSATDVTGKQEVHHVSQLDVLMAVDPGGFGVRQGQDRATPAIVVTGTLPKSNRHLILEAWAEAVTYKEAAHKVVDFCRKYPTIRAIGIERAGQQITFIDLVRGMLKEEGIHVGIREIKPDTTGGRGGGNKDQHILKLEPYFEDGMLLWGKSAIFNELREQYRQFPRGKRVDLLDALSMVRLLWRPWNAAPRQKHEERQAQEREAYYARRGLTRR
jgi:hypothetical protein